MVADLYLLRALSNVPWAIYWADVIYAADRVDTADAGFNDKFIYDEIFLDPIDRNLNSGKLTIQSMEPF